MTTYGEIYQEFKITDIDVNGRKFGYALAMRDVFEDGVEVGVAAWVQRAVEDKKQGFKDFGTTARSQQFSDAASARRWMAAEVAKRIEGNRKSWIRNNHKIIA